ncbi:unnamed protein product [Chrysoparadoxa australica]
MAFKTTTMLAVALALFGSVSGEMGCPLNDPNFSEVEGNCQARPVPADHPRAGATGEIEMREPLGVLEGTFDAGRPNARHISNTIGSQELSGERSNDRFNLLTIFFGQFLDHDLTLALEAEHSEENIVHIDDVGDGMGDLEFVRSFATAPGEFANMNTAWLNLGNVYGDTEDRCQALRADDYHEPGFMKTTTLFRNKEYLPLHSEMDGVLDFAAGPGEAEPIECGMMKTRKRKGSCSPLNGTVPFFACGDVRCNENLVLLSFHTLWLRNHNRLASLALDDIPRGSMSAEEYSQLIFDTARYTNICTWQQIIFEEWLPAVIGQSGMDLMKERTPSGELPPTMSLLFSTSAFRFGHSGLASSIIQASNRGKITRSDRLADLFFDPANLVEDPKTLHRVFNGLRITPHEDIDTFMIDDIRNMLFGNNGAAPHDLLTLNIMRGRDHGLPGFNEAAEHFGTPRYESFEELTGGPSELATKLTELYGEGADAVDKADIFVTGLAEADFGDSQLGSLFTMILVDQFSRIRDADKFWYTEAPSTLEPIPSMAQVIGYNTRAKAKFRGETSAFVISRIREGEEDDEAIEEE